MHSQVIGGFAIPSLVFGMNYLLAQGGSLPHTVSVEFLYLTRALLAHAQVYSYVSVADGVRLTSGSCRWRGRPCL